MIGVNGYPVMMIAMNNDWQELLVHHWKREVQVGDLMRVGTTESIARTYLVVRNQPNPDQDNPHRRRDGWWAALILTIPPVTVAGETYC